MITNDNLLNISLNQGKQFKKTKESFTNSNYKQINASQSNELTNLEDQYQLLSQEYADTFKSATKDSLEALSRTNAKTDPYANKLVSFDNAKGYVTNSGTFKWISDDSMLDNLSGKNNCPQKKDIIKISGNIDGYNIPGTISNNLLVGTPFETGQTCGNEGSNVFVSSFLNDTTATYKGCFQDNNLTKLSGSYSLEQCKNSAINGGYQYFGLQNVDSSTSTGTCVMSNDYNSSIVNGNSYKVSNIIPLWSSNTSGSTGISAVISLQGTLNVLNNDGAAIFSTPNQNSNKQPTNYIGCYGDKEDRAMIFSEPNSATYDYESCKTSAINGQYSYFALQNSPNGTNAQCFLSNDLTQSTKYGLANNCTTTDNGIVSGGAWSNALYNTSIPTTDYFLQILDNGNMCIYRGSTPDSKQDLIWQSNTANTAKSGDILHKADSGKYGRDWIKIGEPLGVNDFIGSKSGTAYLVMQQDGNLVLYTSEIISNCLKMNDGNMGGGSGGNALYALSGIGDKSVIGKMAFINADSELSEYPESMLQYTTEYVLFNGQNNTGNDITSMQVTNIDECQKQCNSSDDCSGFVYQSSINTCFTKNKNAFPNTDLTQDTTAVTGLRKKKPITNYCSSKSVNIDSNAYKSYKKGQDMTSDSKCSEPIISEENKTKLNDLKNQLNELGQQLVQKLQGIKSDKKDINTLIKENTNKFNNDFDEYNKILNKLGINGNNKNNNIATNNIEGMSTLTYRGNGQSQGQWSSDINGVLSDSKLYVIQENYSYILWGLLAVGLTVIAVNKMSK